VSDLPAKPKQWGQQNKFSKVLQQVKISIVLAVYLLLSLIEFWVGNYTSSLA
jgi:hypothetical protein